MKKIIFAFLFLLSNFCQGQKFKTLEEFRKYFIENRNSIDPIEGVWVAEFSIKTIRDEATAAPFDCVIIKEGNDYFQYTIVDGEYSKDGGLERRGYKKFSKINLGYDCLQYDEKCNLRTSSNRFYIEGDRFTYNFEVSKQVECMSKQEINYRIDKKYVYRKTYPLESDINSYNQSDQRRARSGTGFAISYDGLIVTNNHVINEATSIKVRGINGDFSKSYDAKIIVCDKNNDLAIIKIQDVQYSKLGVIPFVINGKMVDVGSSIFVLGYPMMATMGEEIKLTNGIISSKSGFQGDISSYQISAPIQPGNSGGPLFDYNGNLIGVINSKHLGTENVGYAIKSSYLMSLIDQLPNAIKLSQISTTKGKQLTEQVKILKKYTYIIEVN